jgi:hypothetical protein
MRPPKPIKPSVTVHEQPGSTVWVSRYRRPMDGSPELLFFDGFTHETDAQAFKAQMRAAMGKDDCICLTFERPPNAIKKRK